MPTKTNKRTQHAAVYLRMLAIKELAMRRDVSILLKKQAIQISNAYKKRGHAGAESVAIDGAGDWLKVLVPNYAVTIKDFAQYTLNQIEGKSRKAEFTQLTMAFIGREATSKAKNLTQTTKNIITDVIQGGESDGLGIDDIAQNLVDAVGSINTGRAATIARTETHMAAGYASHAQASNVNYTVNKTWVAVEDERTRDSHAEVDGTTLANDDYFDVGDDTLLYPGDPDGSPEEIINCRCSLIYEPADDSEAIVE